MGYYTNYEVNIMNIPEEKYSEIKNEIWNIIGYDADNEGETSHMIFSFESKWYDYEKDMLQFTEKYPDVLVEILGEGEESGDIWKARFRNGESERVSAQIFLPAFRKIF